MPAEVIYMCLIVQKPLVTSWSLNGWPVGDLTGLHVDYCEQHRAIVDRMHGCPRRPDETPDMAEELAAMRELRK